MLSCQLNVVNVLSWGPSELTISAMTPLQVINSGDGDEGIASQPCPWVPRVADMAQLVRCFLFLRF